MSRKRISDQKAEMSCDLQELHLFREAYYPLLKSLQSDIAGISPCDAMIQLFLKTEDQSVDCQLAQTGLTADQLLLANVNCLRRLRQDLCDIERRHAVNDELVKAARSAREKIERSAIAPQNYALQSLRLQRALK